MIPAAGVRKILNHTLLFVCWPRPIAIFFQSSQTIMAQVHPTEFVKTVLADDVLPWMADHCSMPLQGGTLRTARSDLPAGWNVSRLFRKPPQDSSAATACLAALWLLAGDLDKSHALSQEIATREGSFWHGVMHRREGDFSNAKYWFRQVGNHPAYLEIASLLTGNAFAEQLFGPSHWNPSLFVDAVEKATRKPSTHSNMDAFDQDQTLTHLIELQALEWRTFFTYCCQKAVGCA